MVGHQQPRAGTWPPLELQAHAQRCEHRARPLLDPLLPPRRVQARKDGGDDEDAAADVPEGQCHPPGATPGRDRSARPRRRGGGGGRVDRSRWQGGLRQRWGSLAVARGRRAITPTASFRATGHRKQGPVMAEPLRATVFQTRHPPGLVERTMSEPSTPEQALSRPAAKRYALPHRAHAGARGRLGSALGVLLAAAGCAPPGPVQPESATVPLRARDRRGGAPVHAAEFPARRRSRATRLILVHGTPGAATGLGRLPAAAAAGRRGGGAGPPRLRPQRPRRRDAEPGRAGRRRAGPDAHRRPAGGAARATRWAGRWWRAWRPTTPSGSTAPGAAGRLAGPGAGGTSTRCSTWARGGRCSCAAAARRFATPMPN